MRKYRIGEKLTLVINHEVTSSVFAISYFMLSGMKDDIKYINGTAHLAEHLLARSLFCVDNSFMYTNAYVDKEYTCFYGQTFSPYFDELLHRFLHLFRNLQIDLDYMVGEKHVIAHIENKKTAGNRQILDLEKLEYIIFSDDDGLRMPTLISENSFFEIDDSMVKRFVFNELVESKKYIMISGDFKHSEILKIVENVTAEYGDAQKKDNSVLLRDEPLARTDKQNMFLIEGYKPRHSMTAILLNKVDSIEEWFALNILCVFYKTYISNFLQNSRNYLIDLSVKQYENSCLLIFYCFADFRNLMNLLHSIDLSYFSELLVSMKRAFLFPLIEKVFNPLECHKLQFKSICFNRVDKIFQPSKIMEIIDNITPKYIAEVHLKCLSGTYYGIPERSD